MHFYEIDQGAGGKNPERNPQRDFQGLQEILKKELNIPDDQAVNRTIKPASGHKRKNGRHDKNSSGSFELYGKNLRINYGKTRGGQKTCILTAHYVREENIHKGGCRTADSGKRNPFAFD